MVAPVITPCTWQARASHELTPWVPSPMSATPFFSIVAKYSLRVHVRGDCCSAFACTRTREMPRCWWFA